MLFFPPRDSNVSERLLLLKTKSSPDKTVEILGISFENKTKYHSKMFEAVFR